MLGVFIYQYAYILSILMHTYIHSMQFNSRLLDYLIREIKNMADH